MSIQTTNRITKGDWLTYYRFLQAKVLRITSALELTSELTLPPRIAWLNKLHLKYTAEMEAVEAYIQDHWNNIN